MDVVTLGAEKTAMRSEPTSPAREISSRQAALSSNRGAVDGTATNKTARARCSDQVRSIAWLGSRTAAEKPMIRLVVRRRPDDRMLEELVRSPEGAVTAFRTRPRSSEGPTTTCWQPSGRGPVRSLPTSRMRQSPGRKTAIGTHFPDVVADIAAESLVARHAVSLEPCSDSDLELERVVGRNVGVAVLR